MVTHIEPIWKPCSKEEYERAYTKLFYDWVFNYKREPIYGAPMSEGLFAQMEPDKRKIIGYNYFKKSGEKVILVCNSWELDALKKVLS